MVNTHSNQLKAEDIPIYPFLSVVILLFTILLLFLTLSPALVFPPAPTASFSVSASVLLPEAAAVDERFWGTRDLGLVVGFCFLEAVIIVVTTTNNGLAKEPHYTYLALIACGDIPAASSSTPSSSSPPNHPQPHPRRRRCPPGLHIRLGTGMILPRVGPEVFHPVLVGLRDFGFGGDRSGGGGGGFGLGEGFGGFVDGL